MARALTLRSQQPRQPYRPRIAVRGVVQDRQQRQDAGRDHDVGGVSEPSSFPTANMRLPVWAGAARLAKPVVKCGRRPQRAFPRRERVADTARKAEARARRQRSVFFGFAISIHRSMAHIYLAKRRFIPFIGAAVPFFFFWPLRYGACHVRVRGAFTNGGGWIAIAAPGVGSTPT